MKKPYVTISYAQSIDGRIATASGESQWISGHKTLQFVQKLRKENRGILVGIGTVMRDNPELTCRVPHKRSPIRIVLDSKLSIPLESKIIQTAHVYETLILYTEKAPQSKLKKLMDSGLDLVFVDKTSGGYIDLNNALHLLMERGIETVLVEGGSKVITSFLKLRLASRLFITIAPIFIGDGVPATGDIGVRKLEEALKPKTIRVKKMGKDLVWELNFEH
jgi:riboflavin-specific deaminase-like protein